MSSQDFGQFLFSLSMPFLVISHSFPFSIFPALFLSSDLSFSLLLFRWNSLSLNFFSSSVQLWYFCPLPKSKNPPPLLFLLSKGQVFPSLQKLGEKQRNHHRNKHSIKKQSTKPLVALKSSLEVKLFKLHWSLPLFRFSLVGGPSFFFHRLSQHKLLWNLINESLASGVSATFWRRKLAFLLALWGKVSIFEHGVFSLPCAC